MTPALPAARLSLLIVASLISIAPSALAVLPQCPGLDDPYEDNDDCASAVAMPAGLTRGLYTETRLGDHDYFTFQVPAGEIATIDVLFKHADGDVDILVYRAGCAGILGLGFSQTDDEHVEIVNGNGAPLDLVIEVFVNSLTSSDCNDYDLSLATHADPCASVLDDVFEDNDDCASPAGIAEGTYAGLVVLPSDPDYYRTTVPPGQRLHVECAHVHASGDINLFLFDPAIGCGIGFAGSPIAHSITATDDESLTWSNASAAPVQVVLEVSLSPIVPSGCNSYDLEVALVHAECTGPDDGLEDNDSCSTARALAPGQYDDLFVSDTDPDFYSVLVPPGDVLGVDCFYDWAEGALALMLWDPSVACGTGPFTSELALGFTPVDNERLFWLNDTGSPRTIVIEVALTTGTTSNCNTYDLRVEVFPDPCPGGLGEIFCRGVANSTGVGSRLCASGSDFATDNDVLLTVTDLPLNTVGYFVVSQNPTITLVSPSGSSGQLCVASLGVGRQAPILASGTSGSMQLQIDLTVTPQPTAPVPIASGETWCWQLWHRDVGPLGQSTSNFSSARSITFR